jgi:hypothetical protein
MTIEFNGRMVTPLVRFPDGTIAEVSGCKLLLATAEEMENLDTYVGTDVGISFGAVFDLAECVTVFYDGVRYGMEVEVRKTPDRGTT